MRTNAFRLSALICCLPSAAIAAETSDLPAWAAEPLDKAEVVMSGWVDSSARRLDSLFGTAESLDIDNESYLRISQESLWQESEGFDADLNLRFRLDLPTSKDRLRILIESDPEESLGTLDEQGTDARLSQRVENDNSVLGLAKLDPADKRERWSYRYGAGIKLRLPIDPYVRISGERQWQFADSLWQLNSNNRASWFDSDGYSARSSWSLTRPLDEQRTLRSYTKFQWQEEEDTLEFSQRFDISRKLDDRSSLRNGLIMVGESLSDPHFNNYYLQSWYRRDIHRGILFMDLIPELHFPRDSDFDPRWAVTLRFELYLSKSIDSF